MPWEIDHLFLLQHQLKRSLYYLTENDEFEMDVVLNLSDKLINWNDSKLDKEFFTEKYKSTQYLTDWANCRYTIFNGSEMYGHLDLMRDCIDDDIKCDSYMSIVPDIHFHETLLYYMFRSMDVIQDDYYWVSTQIPKMWDSSWDSLVHKDFIDIPYEDHRKIDAYETEKFVRNNIENINIIENTGNKKWACWFDLHSHKLLELIGIPDTFIGYGPMDTFYLNLFEILRANNISFPFKHYIIKNQIISDRWRCIDKQLDDPAPWNHSQDTPLRDFYKKNLKILDTKNNQRKYIEGNFEFELKTAINKILECMK